MRRYFFASLALAGAIVLGLATSAVAQEDQYKIGENTSSTASVDNGPVRMARVSYATGHILYRPAAGVEWSPASVNMPLRQGAQIWVSKGRAELQFDDGSYMRLGNGAVVTLPTLYSDSQGEFTEIKMNEGLATLKLHDAQSIYQVDTPYASVIAHGPSYYRMGIDNGFEVAVHSGDVVVQGSNGKKTLDTGDYLYMASTGSPYEIARTPSEDSWDRWNYDRDQQLSDPHTVHYLPPDIALVAGNLDSYGSWHVAAHYGNVWTPTVYDPTWRPYYHGHWVWVDPYGWTWVSSEPWGWAPYHYGTWIHLGFGWSWVPGPAVQYWSPAVVSFSYYNGDICWAPLCPTEVRYPSGLSLGIGFGGPNWSLFFSIGGCAEYYPAGPFFCAARPWPNYFCNRTVFVNNFYGGGFNTFNTYNRYYPRFDPYNARFGHGITMASASAFGGAGRYVADPRGAADPFVHGRPFGAPAAGRMPMSGPATIRANHLALTPARTFLAASPEVNRFLARPVFRAPLPRQVARVAPSIPRSQVAHAMLRPATGQMAANRAPISINRGAAPNAAANHARMVASSARRTLGMSSSKPAALRQQSAQAHGPIANRMASNAQHARNMSQAASHAQHARNMSQAASHAQHARNMSQAASHAQHARNMSQAASHAQHARNMSQAAAHVQHARNMSQAAAHAQHARTLSHVASQGSTGRVGHKAGFNQAYHARTTPVHVASQQREYRPSHQRSFSPPQHASYHGGGGVGGGFRTTRNFGSGPSPASHGYQFGEQSPHGGGGFGMPSHQGGGGGGGGRGGGQDRKRS